MVSNRPFPSSLVPLFQSESKVRNLSYENEFCTQFLFHANKSHFHKNGFPLRLALKLRHKGTRKWPIKTMEFFCLETISLIVAPWKFDVPKNICFRNINLRGNYHPIVPRQKQSVV